MPSTPVASASPETDARHLHDLASSTAIHLLGFVAQTKKPAFCRRLRPRRRVAVEELGPGGSRGVHTWRPCTCNLKTKRTITPHGWQFTHHKQDRVLSFLRFHSICHIYINFFIPCGRNIARGTRNSIFTSTWLEHSRLISKKLLV